MSSQPPKDFLALSHGHEWVDFYESFDKLVQDHLSRSSELLRKAMSLPEVADREVAQVRDDLESRLTAERAQNQATLSTLKQEITSSHQQAASLAQLVGSLMAQLDRLNGNVESALAKIAENEAIAPSGAAQIESGPPVHVEAPVASAPESASTEWSAEGAEEQSEPVAESNEDWSQLTDEAKDESADEIDLSALAAMEEATNEAEDSDEAEAEVVAANNGSERTRPHWLSMARSGQ